MKHLWMGAAMAAMLVACGPDERPDEVDEAMERGEQLMREAGEALEEFGEDAREAGGRVLDEAREALDDDRDPADETAEEPVRASGADRSLQEIIDDPARTEDAARDQFRNPRQTLEFFGIEPGDTVVEALPGGGWYTRILLPYLGEEGRYHAVNYPMPVFEQIFADRLTDERRAELADWENTFPGQAAAWGGDVDGAFRFGAVPAELEGGADAVLYIRALHNLARFNMLDMAAQDAFALLEPGGVAGVVQHRAPAGEPDERADGSRGYLREADVIAAFEPAGFELEDSSDINANPRDTADWEQGVWALPPTLGGPDDERERMREIGESDRMTLKFRKPQ
jgi:predicted methyltransferase